LRCFLRRRVPVRISGSFPRKAGFWRNRISTTMSFAIFASLRRSRKPEGRERGHRTEGHGESRLTRVKSGVRHDEVLRAIPRDEASLDKGAEPKASPPIRDTPLRASS
jgi:hypothetical protein